MGQKKFGSKKFWVKKFWVIKILGKKKIWSKRFGSEICWFKKTGRVNPRGRIYDSPPPENSRVKILLGRS